MAIVIVSGTDTEIGKTTVGCGLARALSDSGIAVRAIKPVESGTEPEPTASVDGVRLARATGQTEPACAFTRLRKPLAPPVAADIDQVTLDMDRWERRIRAEHDECDVLIVEGAGGLLSPLTEEETTRDLARRLDAGVLLVAPDVLGCLNHTLLAVEALEHAGLETLGVVFSAPAEPDESTGRNSETYADFSGSHRVAMLPRVQDWREAAEHLGAIIDWLPQGTGL